VPVTLPPFPIVHVAVNVTVEDAEEVNEEADELNVKAFPETVKL
jgi:hypothetical protein